MNRFVVRAMHGEPLVVFGNGSQRRDVFFVTDAVAALLAAADQASTAAPCLNLGAGESRSLVSIARAVAQRVEGVEVELQPWPAADKLVETGDFLCSAARAHSVLGWSPQVSFEEGLDRTVEFYRQVVGRAATGTREVSGDR